MGTMRNNRLIWPILAVVLAVLVYAWIDGGREPLRQISQPLAVPGQNP